MTTIGLEETFKRKLGELSETEQKRFFTYTAFCRMGHSHEEASTMCGLDPAVARKFKAIRADFEAASYLKKNPATRGELVGFSLTLCLVAVTPIVIVGALLFFLVL